MLEVQRLTNKKGFGHNMDAMSIGRIQSQAAHPLQKINLANQDLLPQLKVEENAPNL